MQDRGRAEPPPQALKRFSRKAKAMANPADGGRYMEMVRRWLTGGWSGKATLVDDLFSGIVRTNGVLVGVAGPKRRIQERLAGFPISRRPSRICSQLAIKSPRRLFDPERMPGPHGSVMATGKPVEVPDFTVWRFGDGKVVEISTIQDQFALLKQIGYLQEGIYAA